MVGCLVDFCLLSTHIIGKLKKQLQLYVCTGVARWLFLYYNNNIQQQKWHRKMSKFVLDKEWLLHRGG